MVSIGSAEMGSGSAKTYRLAFNGTAGQYFGIKATNVALTILTLGIWSAWAKVRTKRYFLGNTTLDGTGFEYHATGGQILKGRLLAVAAIFVLSLVSEIHAAAGIVVLIAYALLIPWALNKSLQFNARMTSWRTVRFDFTPNYGEAFLSFIVMPFLSIISFGLLFPWAAHVSSRYICNGYRFGTSDFTASPSLVAFYKAGYKAGLQTLAVVLLIVALVYIANSVMGPSASDGDALIFGESGVLEMLPMMAPMASVIGLVLGLSYFGALTRNITVNALSLEGGHRFGSDLSGIRMMGIVATNMVAVLATVGLAYPWARVRQYRTEATAVSILPAGSLDAFVDAAKASGHSFGSEIADVVGVDAGV